MPSLPQKPWWRASHNGWYVTFRGKQVLLAKGKDNKALANKRLAKLLSEDRPRVVAQLPTLGQLRDAFLERSARMVKPATFTGYQWTTTNFVVHMGESTHVSSVSENNVILWVDSNQWARGTRTQRLAVVRAMFQYAVRQNIIAFNPCRGVNYGMSQPRHFMMTKQQTEAVLNFAKEHRAWDVWALLAVLHATGMRPSEALRLESAWVSDECSRAVFPSHKTDKHSTRKRAVYFPESIRPTVARLKATDHRTLLVNPTQGNPWTPSHAGSVMRRIRKALGFGRECCLESFRHQWITDALERGVPIATVAELAGNSVSIIQRHYSKLSARTDHLESAAETVRP